MNRVHQAVSIACAVVVLSACASSGGMASAPQADHDRYVGRIMTDAAYVAAVEQVARDRGVQVQWVNPPQKRYTRLSASR